MPVLVDFHWGSNLSMNLHWEPGLVYVTHPHNQRPSKEISACCAEKGLMVSWDLWGWGGCSVKQHWGAPHLWEELCWEYHSIGRSLDWDKFGIFSGSESWETPQYTWLEPLFMQTLTSPFAPNTHLSIETHTQHCFDTFKNLYSRMWHANLLNFNLLSFLFKFINVQKLQYPNNLQSKFVLFSKLIAQQKTMTSCQNLSVYQFISLSVYQFISLTVKFNDNNLPLLFWYFLMWWSLIYHAIVLVLNALILIL